MADQFEVTHRLENGVPVVLVRGEIDITTAPQLGAQFDDLFESEHWAVTVDLREVAFMDSTALGVLVGAQKHGQDHGGGLRLIVDSPRILKIFEITGLTQLFEIVDH